MGLTPMMQQYLDIKQQHADALLLFRLGDFYELFFDDAVTASKVLEITLTGRDAGEQGRVPMCGVPFHAAEQYIGRLIEAGFCVAICEQVEDPKAAKGLVKREVIRVVTPGTWMKDGDTDSRYLACLCQQADVIGLALVDVGTGDVRSGSFANMQDAHQALVVWSPIEVLVSEQDNGVVTMIEDWAASASARVTKVERPASLKSVSRDIDVIRTQYGVMYTEALGLDEASIATVALGRLLRYLQDTQKQVLGHLKSPQNLVRDGSVIIDTAARRNLELVETQRSRHKRGSLYGLLDKTQTAMGSRLLRRWIEHPIRNVEEIEERLNAVEWLMNQLFTRAELEELMARVYDLERLVGKVGFGTANARDLVAIAQSLQVLPSIAQRLEAADSRLLRRLAGEIPDLSSLCDQIVSTFVDEPPVGTQDGGMVRAGIDAELDKLRSLHIDGKQWLAQFEQEQREKTGIRSLKIGYNKVFGYYIEVSKANVHLVPEGYQRKQTLASAERYTQTDLKDREDEILHAEERALSREYAIFLQVREQVHHAISGIQQAAACISQVDVLTGLASVSIANGYVRPLVTGSRGIDIRLGRHPVVEAAQPGSFVPNNVRLDDENPFILLTGPNMAGKSTYMRQTAIIVILAHMGCFVPAEAAQIGVVDRIFTRIGASDDLGAGQSTFMVEMVELAEILRQSTAESLVLLDEIGRGTSTYDGMSLAEAVMETLLAPPHNPLTLFATHYHELTVSADALPGVRNLSVAVQETPTGVTFLHTVVERPAERSYGIQVAKLAGVPENVITRASSILVIRESTAEAMVQSVAAASSEPSSPSLAQSNSAGNSASDTHPLGTKSSGTGASGASPSGVSEEVLARVSELLDELATLSVNSMTPLEAITELHGMVERGKEVRSWVKSKL